MRGRFDRSDHRGPRELVAGGEWLFGRNPVEEALAAAKGEAVADTDTGCAFYTAENIDAPEIADNLYD